MRAASAIDSGVPPKTTRVCPMKLWLDQRALTQVWLARKMGVAKNTIYMWFKKIEPCPAERRSEMSRVARGEVTVAELDAFFDSSLKTPRRKKAPVRLRALKAADADTKIAH